MVIEDLREWKRYELSNGQYLRSNELEGLDSDIVIHKNRDMLNRYYEILSIFRPRTVFEIGVKEGGSLVLWHELLKCQVVGIDKDITQISPSSLKYIKGKNITVGHMNSRSKIVIDYTRRLFSNQIDMIIDDCSHTIEDIPYNFKTHWDSITSGGKYIIEDWKALHPIHREDLLTFIYTFLPPKIGHIVVWDEMICISRNSME
ncbi:hypothetical protein LCGC14_0956950 [marine sediment metagenome]|uniref:Rhamnosyl O-methyltransferase n=1 Tax=marine sediment metagenome TaxID=412755 RepID=A0A0F9NFM6_9ZZZZ